MICLINIKGPKRDRLKIEKRKGEERGTQSAQRGYRLTCICVKSGEINIGEKGKGKEEGMMANELFCNDVMKDLRG